MSGEKRVIRIMPMPVVHPVWEHDDSEYPEVVKVSMANGKIRTYRLETEQPAPQIVDSQQIARMFRENTYGGYKARHGKSR